MLDINFIRENKELVKKSIMKRGVKYNPNLVDELLNLDESWRKLKGELDKLNINSRDELNEALSKGEIHLKAIRGFLFDIMDALEKANSLSASTLDSYKANVTTARTNINTASTNISGQKQSINLQNAIIISEEVSIGSYEASVGNIEAQIEKTVLRSPINGVVTKQGAKVGEIAAANIILVSILSSIYEIETFIPEVDIAKVKVGNSVRATLDAYGKDAVFEARVISINPAETMVEGVATYKTILRFDSGDKPIKSGMTANLDILTAQKNNTLIVPQRAVTSANGDKFVNNGATTIKVITGLRGSDGNIEILEGLKEGDKIVISQ